MDILFFDTETNGLPRSRYAKQSDVSNWPRVVSVAWCLCKAFDDHTEVGEIVTHIIKPDSDMKWSEEAARIHGITLEKANQEGKKAEDILPIFKEYSQRASIIISHNLAFDKPTLLAEFLRSNMSIDWWPSIEYCTMEASKNLCKLPFKNPKPNDPYKFPRLIELQQYLFHSTDGIQFHTAEGDVECLIQCFNELVLRRIVPLDEWRRRLRV